MYNHPLAAVGPAAGTFCYYTPTAGGHARPFSRPTGSFWCCVATGMENPPQYAAGIYTHDDRDLWVNLFVPSRLTWDGLTVTLATRYPLDGHVVLTIHTDPPRAMAVRVRVPAGADGATVNGVAVDARPNAVVDRTWADGDMVTVEMPLRLRTEPLAGDGRTVAVFAGPLLLAGRLAAVDPAAELLGDSPVVPKGADPVPTPAVGDRPASSWLRPAGEAGTFRTDDAGLAQDVDLVPFYRVGSYRYRLYWSMAR